MYSKKIYPWVLQIIKLVKVLWGEESLTYLLLIIGNRKRHGSCKNPKGVLFDITPGYLFGLNICGPLPIISLVVSFLLKRWPQYTKLQYTDIAKRNLTFNKLWYMWHRTLFHPFQCFSMAFVVSWEKITPWPYPCTYGLLFSPTAFSLKFLHIGTVFVTIRHISIYPRYWTGCYTMAKYNGLQAKMK